jgi:hypothetical protein
MSNRKVLVDKDYLGLINERNEALKEVDASKKRMEVKRMATIYDPLSVLPFAITGEQEDSIVDMKLPNYNKERSFLTTAGETATAHVAGSIVKKLGSPVVKNLVSTRVPVKINGTVRYFDLKNFMNYFEIKDPEVAKSVMKTVKDANTTSVDGIKSVVNTTRGTKAVTAGSKYATRGAALGAGALKLVRNNLLYDVAMGVPGLIGAKVKANEERFHLNKIADFNNKIRAGERLTEREQAQYLDSINYANKARSEKNTWLQTLGNASIADMGTDLTASKMKPGFWGWVSRPLTTGAYKALGGDKSFNIFDEEKYDKYLDSREGYEEKLNLFIDAEKKLGEGSIPYNELEKLNLLSHEQEKAVKDFYEKNGKELGNNKVYKIYDLPSDGKDFVIEGKKMFDAVPKGIEPPTIGEESAIQDKTWYNYHGISYEERLNKKENEQTKRKKLNRGSYNSSVLGGI